ncbi:hypothetical protein EV194_1294 [Natronoflexus pectinivorans]|uniref:Uncharacterized protein n=1 Tax=Natronoflexus pectinivorans TaxID=682526 RepID=A0A4R2G3L8_9BACT|nr:hypothetical protein EV194_1294 [Natronoflexus pectinivorans]
MDYFNPIRNNSIELIYFDEIIVTPNIFRNVMIFQ